jgi:hypothetical protein
MTRITVSFVILIIASSARTAAAEMTAVERQRLVAHLDMTASWLIDEVTNLSPAQLAFRPAPGSWSIMEVLDHLIVVAPIYWEDLQTALKRPVKPNARTSDADILWYGIDRTAREKAIPTEVPKGKLATLGAALDAYRREHARLVQYAQTTTDDLRSHYVERQGSDAYQWALLISTHEQRHILQIREIKRSPNYPRK